MRWLSALSKLAGVLLLVPAFAVVTAHAQDAKPFTNEQLDQMTAQVALYPDSLLSQLFMATTYPDEFAEAAKWSKAHPDSKGDDAVKLVENEPWDPSVASLVAFPEVLITLGEKPDWVRNMGDAFLAQPEDVMNSVQRLRAQAQKAGNLKSNEQVKVTVEAPAGTDDDGGAAGRAAAGDRDPAGAAVGRLRAGVQPDGRLRSLGLSRRIRRTTIRRRRATGFRARSRPASRGAWASASATRCGAASTGAGTTSTSTSTATTTSTSTSGSTSTATGRRGTTTPSIARPRTAAAMRRARISTRSTRPATASNTAARTRSRDASRERAAQTMQDRGGGDKSAARDKAQSADKSAARDKAQSADKSAARDKAQSADRDAARQRAEAASKDNALKGAGSPQAKAQADRGSASKAAAQRTERRGSRRQGVASGGGDRAAKPTGGGDRAAKPAGGGKRPGGDGDGGGRSGGGRKG